MHNTSENRRFRTVSLPIMTVYRFFEKISSFHDLDFKQGVEKRPSRFSLIGDAKKSCAGNFALRARCKWRTARNLFLKSGVEKRASRFSLIGDAKKSCAGNFALRARCKWRTARNLFLKSGVEKRASRFSLIGDAKKSCALLGFFSSCPKGAVYLK